MNQEEFVGKEMFGLPTMAMWLKVKRNRNFIKDI